MALVSDSIGRVLGRRYRLLSVLGTGASAHVFLAEDVALGRRVAVKVLLPALAGDDAFLRRFRAEARAVASLNHPHLLGVHDWGEDVDGPFLVTEYLGGGSLRDMLDDGVRLSPAQAARLGAEAASGLAYAHGRGLVHRDVKPANLLFDEEGRVRVADFGVARALSEASWTEPAGSMIGTARYAAPEQAEGRALDARVDVYSLALVLYECCTGQVPFSADTALSMLMARVGAPLPGHPDLGPLGPLLALAGAPEPADRLDAAQMAVRLEALSADLGAPDPLPLRPPEVRRSSSPMPVPPGDLTLMARGGPGPPGVHQAGPAGLGGSASPPVDPVDPLATSPSFGSGDSTLWDVAPPTALGEAPVAPVPPARRGRPRRVPTMAVVAAVVVVVAALVAGGAALAVRDGVFTPSHPVPSLGGRTLAGARTALADDHFPLAVAGSAYSTSVPAGRVLSQQPGQGTVRKQGTTVRVELSKGLPPVAVPSLAQLSCTAAKGALARVHLQGTCPDSAQAYDATVPAGKVISWSAGPAHDPTRLLWGATVTLSISEGPPPVPVPSSLAGGTYAQAQAALGSAGLGATEAQESSTSVPAGEVTRTVPSAGTVVKHGTVVTVYVSTGPPLEPMPDVEQMGVGAATAALARASLSVSAVYGPQKGTVFTTIPAPGVEVKVGSAVVLYTF